LQKEIDTRVTELYKFSNSDWREIEEHAGALHVPAHSILSYHDEIAASIVSHLLGAAYGRWDICFATGERQPPEVPDPFDPLPVCPPGMLQNSEGLPAAPSDVPADYPLRIAWPGILVDEENHPEDIVARVREALRVIWRDKSDDIEAEACEILGVKAKPKENLDALRVYFRDPNRFFKDHLARYSKSRRKAPIYWPLSTESGSYTLWIYYHRLDSQTLYTCVSEFIDPKREALGRDLEVLGRRIGTGGSTEERQQLDELTTFLAELKTLRDRLLEVAGLPYRPNLNDGVQITAAPLWKLLPPRPVAEGAEGYLERAGKGQIRLGPPCPPHLARPRRAPVRQRSQHRHRPRPRRPLLGSGPFRQEEGPTPPPQVPGRRDQGTHQGRARQEGC